MPENIARALNDKKARLHLIFIWYNWHLLSQLLLSLDINQYRLQTKTLLSIGDVSP